jgi:ribonucleoside-diphosphate reductase alpha chain
VDYIFRWLDMTFPDGKVAPAYRSRVAIPPGTPMEENAATAAVPASPADEPAAFGTATRVDEQFKTFMEDAPACDVCGSITVRNGACYRCHNCGNSMGCS